ncbi:hypothetical protein E3P86_03131 [Wallemia ichthyophaga]|uniref:Uncharacterized protein n=1 Tax=Wallemia ichthyophaga TaxID=245174 RepID=A0A4T0IYN1_WALIC|nr:hypothetical protein E3P86_03131 [Wallemia ichthyophaga]
MGTQHARAALHAAHSLRAVPRSWKARIGRVLREGEDKDAQGTQSKRRLLIYGSHTKQLVEALLRDPLAGGKAGGGSGSSSSSNNTPHTSATDILQQRRHLGGRRNEGRVWTIQHSHQHAPSTPTTEHVLIPLPALEKVDVVEWSDGDGDRESWSKHAHAHHSQLTDEAVASHDLIIDNGPASAYLRGLFGDRPRTISINGRNELAVDATGALGALDAFEAKDVNGYTRLTDSSNIRKLKQVLVGDMRVAEREAHAVHAVKLALSATDRVLRTKEHVLASMERESEVCVEETEGECAKLLQHFPSSTHIQHDHTVSLHKALAMLRSFPVALLPIRIDDLGAFVEGILNKHFADTLALEFAAFDGAVAQTNARVHHLAHEQLERAGKRSVEGIEGLDTNEDKDMPLHLHTAIHQNNLGRNASALASAPSTDSRSIAQRTLNTLTQPGGLPDSIAARMQAALVRAYGGVLSTSALGYAGAMGEWCTTQSAVGLAVLGGVWSVKHVLTKWTTSVGMFESSWKRGYALIEADSEDYKQTVRAGIMKDARFVDAVWDRESTTFSVCAMPSSSATKKTAKKTAKSDQSMAPSKPPSKAPKTQPKSILKKKEAVQEPSSEDGESDEGDVEGDSESDLDSDVDADSDASASSASSGSYTTLKPKKRKRKNNETEANTFASALTNLADTSATSAKNLEILPQANKSLKKHRMQLKAQKVLRDEAKHKEDIGRVRDVVSGWAVPSTVIKGGEGVADADNAVNAHVDSGADKEKRLRKVAQKGVVRLFNAILAAQKAESGAKVVDKEKDRGLGKQRLEAPANFPSQNKKQAKNTDTVAKNAFMDAIRKG